MWVCVVWVLSYYPIFLLNIMIQRAHVCLLKNSGKSYRKYRWTLSIRRTLGSVEMAEWEDMIHKQEHVNLTDGMQSSGT